jgi:hypothetical protein
MEANEVQELQEQHEHALEPGDHEPGEREPAGHEAGEHGGRGSLKHVSFTMSVLAVLVAIVTVLGHRTHTEAVLMQARASDQWNFYQAKKIRQNDTQLSADILTAVAGPSNAAARTTVAGYEAHMAKWKKDLDDEQKTARSFEERVEVAERKASRFDLAEAMLEIALVVTSITLLTRLSIYWVAGMVFGAIGLVVAVSGLLVR